ncbi:MAG TPA: histidine kinase [Candidatus Saccharimonadales bacterium]|nr:histidine kinase [Candidatus Saccharimonadales bacterium]
MAGEQRTTRQVGAPDTMMWPIPTAARLGWAAIWLVFLGYPISDILGTGYAPARATIAWICLAGFAALYLFTMWTCLSLVPRVATGVRLLPLAALFVTGITLTLVFRGQWTGLLVYCGVAAGWTLRWRFLVPVLLALGAFMVVSGVILGYSWADLGFITFLTVALGFTMLAFRRLIATVIELRTARAEVARLAIADERLRISRDVHDILGHSLSVIALKSQVARRLMHSDPDAAAEAMGDVESVARDSLAEVRAMVTGYRQRSLADELQGARDVLDAAGIAFAVTRDSTVPPAPVDSLLAWTVREGVTNVLRHSRAHHCEISLEAGNGGFTVVIADDGVGGVASAGGSGLHGLRERVGAAGGRLDAGPGERGGFRLEAYVPRAAA